MMTSEERKLFEPFFTNGKLDEESEFEITMESGDQFLIEIHGEGESEINPLTGEDDYYWGIVYRVKKVLNNVTNNYCDDSLIEISKYNFPVKIFKK